MEGALSDSAELGKAGGQELLSYRKFSLQETRTMVRKEETTQRDWSGLLKTMSAGDAEEKANEQSEWTRVSRKGKGKRSNRQTKNVEALPPVAGAPENFLPNPAPQLSVQDIRFQHDKIATKWRSTSSCSKLREIVKANAASHAPITRAICLGLGAFDPEDGSWLAQRRSHIQMAAFLTIVDTLEECYNGVEKERDTRIACFYQEPRFAQPDKDFIASLQGKIVESPASYHLIDETTLVFGVHLYRDIWADALQRSLPGMFVGTGWDVWEQ